MIEKQTENQQFKDFFASIIITSPTIMRCKNPFWFDKPDKYQLKEIFNFYSSKLVQEKNEKLCRCPKRFVGTIGRCIISQLPGQLVTIDEIGIFSLVLSGEHEPFHLKERVFLKTFWDLVDGVPKKSERVRPQAMNGTKSNILYCEPRFTTDIENVEFVYSTSDDLEEREVGFFGRRNFRTCLQNSQKNWKIMKSQKTSPARTSSTRTSYRWKIEDDDSEEDEDEDEEYEESDKIKLFEGDYPTGIESQFNVEGDFGVHEVSSAEEDVEEDVSEEDLSEEDNDDGYIDEEGDSDDEDNNEEEEEKGGNFFDFLNKEVQPTENNDTDSIFNVSQQKCRYYYCTISTEENIVQKEYDSFEELINNDFVFY